MISKPIRDAYWVVPNWLMAGDCLTDLAWLKGLGVSAFVDLTLEGELPSHARMLPSGVHQRFPVQDGRAPDSRELTCGALDSIDDLLEAGGPSVHCMGGAGRAGPIVGCWLARHGHPGHAALARLEELWRECPSSQSISSPVTPEQVQFVLQWREVR